MIWISVKDRLPENIDDVLITDGEDVVIAYYSRGGWGYQEGILEAENYDGMAVIRISTKPTHWAPLPELPQENS